jgi:hypothetical protein
MQGFRGIAQAVPLFFAKHRHTAAMLDMAASCTIESQPNSSAAPGASFRNESL